MVSERANGKAQGYIDTHILHTNIHQHTNTYTHTQKKYELLSIIVKKQLNASATSLIKSHIEEEM